MISRRGAEAQRFKTKKFLFLTSAPLRLCVIMVLGFGLTLLVFSGCPRNPREPAAKFTFSVAGELRPDAAGGPLFPGAGGAALADLAPFFRGRDLVLAELAGGISPSSPSRPRTWDLAGLTALGGDNVKVLSLANDASLVAGREALASALDQLTAQGFYLVGVGLSPRQAQAPIYLSRSGVTVAVVAFLMQPPAGTAPCPDCPGPARYDRGVLNDALKAMKSRARYRLVVLHLPDRDLPGFTEPELASAREAIDFGADLIIGYGPATAGGLYRLRGKWAIAGMGRLTGDAADPPGKICDGLVLSAEFTPDQIMNLRLSPLNLVAGKPRLLRGKEGQLALQHLVTAAPTDAQNNVNLIDDILYLKTQAAIQPEKLGP
jgi:hypothetical protein